MSHGSKLQSRRLTAARTSALVALALATLPCFSSSLPTHPPVTVELVARSFAPGEPVRVHAIASEPLETLTGLFLEHPVFFVRGGEPGGNGEAWTGWTMIALDQPPGPATVSVWGQTVAGDPVKGGRTVTVEARVFPEETLAVAPKYVEPPPEVRARLERERRKLSAIYDTRRPVVLSQAAFVRPVPGEPTSVFGTRRMFNGQPRSPHPGLDLRAATGTPVRASGDGHVVLAGDLYYSGDTVILDHGGGLFTLYAHLSELHVREGEDVGAGRILGLSGATGRVTGPHLHWGAKIGSRPFDPRALLDPRLFRGWPEDQ